jgi:regulator of PEP synthase PpsR (kinase-PPPase family)
MKSKKRKKAPVEQRGKKSEPCPIYLVSGASGSSGSQIIETVLAQFPKIQVSIIKMTHVRRREQVKEVIAKALKTGGTVVYTLVDPELRKTLIFQGEKQKIATIDLMGNLLDHLADVLGCPPVGKPGLYRKLHKEYFDRIDAIEFTIAHDDGQGAQDLSSADMVLIGVSRSGKTPLSMYLAVHGWKVANIPLIIEVPPPHELLRINHRRVICLSISYEDLMMHRKKRKEEMGILGPSKYTDRFTVLEEMEAARKICKKGGFHVISVTGKPIESIAEEIIERLNMNFSKKPFKKR